MQLLIFNLLVGVIAVDFFFWKGSPLGADGCGCARQFFRDLFLYFGAGSAMLDCGWPHMAHLTWGPAKPTLRRWDYFWTLAGVVISVGRAPFP